MYLYNNQYNKAQKAKFKNIKQLEKIPAFKGNGEEPSFLNGTFLLNNKAIILNSQDNPGAAMNYAKKALDEKTKFDPENAKPPYFSDIHNTMGIIHIKQKNLKEAFNSLNDALRLKLKETKNDAYSIPVGYIYYNIGKVHELMQNYKEALNFFNKALSESSNSDLTQKLNTRISKLKKQLETPKELELQEIKK